MFADGLAQPEPGATVQLSLDRSIQAIADAALAERVIAQQGEERRGGGARGRDRPRARDGELPDLRPELERGARRRRAIAPVTDAYEAGSVMKMFIDRGRARRRHRHARHRVRSSTAASSRSARTADHRRARRPVPDRQRASSSTRRTSARRRSRSGSAATSCTPALERFGFGAQDRHRAARRAARHAARRREVARHRARDDLVRLRPDGHAAADRGRRSRRSATTACTTQPRIVERVDRRRRHGAVRGDARGAPRGVGEDRGRRCATMLATRVRGRQAAAAPRRTIVVPGFKCGGKTGTAHKYDPATQAVRARPLPVVVRRARADRSIRGSRSS